MDTEAKGLTTKIDRASSQTTSKFMQKNLYKESDHINLQKLDSRLYPGLIRDTIFKSQSEANDYVNSLVSKMKEIPKLEKDILNKLPSESGFYRPNSQEEFNNQLYEYGIGNIEGNCMSVTGALSGKPDRYEAEFSYQPHMNNPHLKTYISPEFQHDFQEATQNHVFMHNINNGFGIKSSDQKMFRAKMNKNQKNQSSIASDQCEMRPDGQAKMKTESNSSTPVNNDQKYKNLQGRLHFKAGSTSVGPRRLNKKNKQLSSTEGSNVKNRSPAKSYIYRMNSSFSRDGTSTKNTMNGPTSDANLPTISQPSGNQGSKTNNAVTLKRKNGKPDPLPAKGKINAKETLAKRNGVKKDSATTKPKNLEEEKLKKDGALKFIPKLNIDVPFTAEWIRHNNLCYENETRWISRIFGREEYQRREQIRCIDTTKIFKVVYDNVDKSPYYVENSIPYLDDKKLIQIKDNSAASFQQNRFKNRGYRRPLINSGIPKKDRIYSDINPYYKVEDVHDVTLIFESRFECGNLKRAVQICDYEYDLIVQSDYNSQGYSQWYYFKCSNTRKDVKYTFNMYNFFKPDSLYNQGMKPLIYSEKKSKFEKIGWSRIGEDVCYYQNTTKKKTGNGYLYTLSFMFEFPYDDDEVYFCHHFPYSYRDCKAHLDSICSDNKEDGKSSVKDKVRKIELCKSLAENSLDLVIITNFLSTDLEIAEREAVIITGRVHPGESNSSFIVEGILDFLVSERDEAKALRDKYVFKVVPMLNPDGVIIGNYRCSLSGQDLNRQWAGPTSRVFPEIYYTKQMLKKTLESRKIFMFVDVHGHSRKRNVFMYGCHNKDTNKRNMEKIFPMKFSSNHSSFSFEDCNFNMTKDRETTGRVVVRKEFDVVNSFTLEASFFGADRGTYKDYHFTPSQLKDVGRSFCLTLNEMDDSNSKANMLKELESMLTMNIGAKDS